LSELAFPQIALLEQNLQLARRAHTSLRRRERFVPLPAYSVVKEPSLRARRSNTAIQQRLETKTRR
jgi:hypothetical protein